MSRSLKRLRTRRSGWRRTATEAASRRIVGPEPTLPRAVIADSNSRLSDGVIIETSVLARLLGVKLLTLEGTVLVSPAQVRDDGYQVPAARAVPVEPTGGEPGAVPRGIEGESGRRDKPGGAVGARLGLAARLLRESTHDLHSIEPRR